MIDSHTHTLFSHDGKSPAADMAQRGQELNMRYMAFTDHCDYDYIYIPGYEKYTPIDLEGYIAGAERLKGEYPFLALGLEVGYSEKAVAKNAELPFEKFDVILNSVHTVNGVEAYFREFFDGKDKKEAFNEYLNKVYESLDAPYRYDVVSHIGYCRKNCPYEDKNMLYCEYGEALDRILSKIIRLDKSLEVNSNIRTDGFMPTVEIIERYYLLGGRKITFGSDSHLTARLGEKYQEAVGVLREIGFEYWTVYRKGVAQKIEM